MPWGTTIDTSAANEALPTNGWGGLGGCSVAPGGAFIAQPSMIRAFLSIRWKVSMFTNPPLEQAARDVSQYAHAPYSNFPVGAVLAATDGQVFAGCNVENASYGLSMCAERGALFRGVAEGARKFSQIVIYTPTREPTPPCGACRQALAEFAPELTVVAICDGPQRREWKLSELLPEQFGLGSS